MWQAVFVVLAVVGQTEPTETVECSGHWVGYADYLNWQARSSGWVSPVYCSRGGESGETPYFEPLAAEPRRGSGIRAGLGRVWPNGWQATWNYTNFHASDREDLDTGDYLTIPLRESYYWRGSNAHLRSEIDYGVHDLELSHCLPLTETLDLHILGGFRWARMSFARSDLILDAVTLPVPAEEFRRADVNHAETTELDAYGVRIGTQADWRFGDFILFGRGAVSGLYATDSHFASTADTPIPLQWGRRFSGGTTAVEAAAGLSFTYRCVEIAAGYELTVWSDILPNSPAWSAETTFHDLVLDGLFARVTCRY